MMSSCPAEWSDPSTRYRCEHPDTTYQDPLFDVPVTSYRTNITYRNRHCAMCNSDLEAGTTDTWYFYFACGNPWLGVGDDQIISHLSYSDVSKSWSMNMSAYPGLLKYCNLKPFRFSYSCIVDVFPTELAQRVLRTCTRRIVDTCPDDWTGDYVRAQCGAYTNHVCLGDTVYRNGNCLSCNNNGRSSSFYCSIITNWTALGKEWSGPGCGSWSIGAPPIMFPTDFTLLLKWQKRSSPCLQDTDLYDPFKKTCRKSFTESKSKCKVGSFHLSLFVFVVN
jgi:hypothetical protein